MRLAMRIGWMLSLSSGTRSSTLSTVTSFQRSLASSYSPLKRDSANRDRLMMNKILNGSPIIKNYRRVNGGIGLEAQ